MPASDSVAAVGSGVRVFLEIVVDPELLSILTLVLAAGAAAAAIWAGLTVRAQRQGQDEERLVEAMRRQIAELRAELDLKGATQRMELTDALTKLGGGLDARVA